MWAEDGCLQIFKLLRALETVLAKVQAIIFLTQSISTHTGVG